MSAHLKRCLSFNCFIALGCLVTASTVLAEPSRVESANDSGAAVDFFEAIKNEQIAVRFIPADASRGNILINNQTDEPVFLKLPSAFAAVPVLAQLGQQGMGQQGFGQQAGGGGGSNQAVGGGMDLGGGQQGRGQGAGQNFGGGNNRQIGGFMRIAPNKPRKIKAITVCLEHGKPEPNPRIKYTIMPIDQYTDDARIATLCSELANRNLRQNVAQATAWHLANDLDWKKIAGLNRLESKYLGNIRFFSTKEIGQAEAFVKSLDPSATSSY